MQHPLKVGLVLDALEVPFWIDQIIEGILQIDHLELGPVLLPKDATHAPSLYRDYKRVNWKSARSIYLYLESFLFSPKPDAQQKVSAAPLVDQALVHRVDVVWQRPFFSLRSNVAARLRSQKPDVMLLFGIGLPGPDILGIPPYGYWYPWELEHLLQDKMYIGFPEVFQRKTSVLTGIKTVSDTEGRSEGFLELAHSPVNPRSAIETRNMALLNYPPLILRALRKLARHRELKTIVSLHRKDILTETVESEKQAASLKPIHLINPVRYWVRDRFVSHFNRNVWKIGFCFSPMVDERFGPKAESVTFLEVPEGLFWADPFPIHWNDAYYIFFEECPLGKNLGCIAYVKVDRSGHVSPAQIVIQNDYHMAFPFLFSWQGDLFMIADTPGMQRVEVYRCEHFPDQWSFHKVIFESDQLVSDPVVTFGEGKWWLFCSLAPKGCWNRADLHLFYADHPFGPWMSHPQNPVKIDVRSARSAGNLIKKNGRLYRPAQDCAQRYGYAISINQIDELSTLEYKETTVASILPGFGKHALATHTINQVDDLYVIDALFRERKPIRPFGSRSVA